MQLRRCSYYQNSVAVWVADTSLIEQHGDSILKDRVVSPRISTISSDDDTKDIKNIYVDSEELFKKGFQDLLIKGSYKVRSYGWVYEYEVVQGGWWRGLVLGGDQVNVIVFFAYRAVGDQHYIFPKTHLRIHQKWCLSGGCIFWLYRKRLIDEAFQVGDEVEIVGSEGMHKFSLYRAQIVGMHGELVEVEYYNRLTFGGERLSEFVLPTKVRSIPDAVVGDFKPTDFVDAWLEGGWWGGIVLGGNEQSAIIFFPYKPTGNQHLILPKSQLRIHQRWTRAQPYEMWLYRKSFT
ncbi:hypothetical protein LXL04_022291 [Taraxacum kok-saghyz]